MDDFEALAMRAANGNAEAAAFLLCLHTVLHFFDDVADRDRWISRREAEAATFAALVSLPRNRFYRANFDELSPLLARAVQNWWAANAIEDDALAAEMPVSFILRSSYVDLVAHTALLCGGIEHGRVVTLEVRRLAHRETLPGYCANLAMEKSARGEPV